MTSPGFTPLVLALPSLTPSLAIEILPHGLTIHRIIVQADGKTHDILIGPEKPEDFLSEFHKYHNTIVGRYTNRVPVGEHQIERGGFKSQFVAQGNQKDPKVSLHGGPKGFDDVDWEPIDPFSSTLFSDEEKVSIGSIPAAVIFRYTSPDGDQGFPGTLLNEVLIGLVNPSQVAIDNAKQEYPLGSILFVYRAKLIEEKKVTPVNLTQHWGFNLEASLQGDESTHNVKDHNLHIKSGHSVELDPSFLSTGKLNPVQGTPRDHKSKRIGDQWPNDGYDEFYVFEKSAPTPIPTRIPLSEFPKMDLIQDVIHPRQADPSSPSSPPVVELSSDKSGLNLSFFTNQSGVQFYSGNLILPDSSRKRIHGGSGQLGKGDGYKPGAAAFLEFHEPLAAWLHPETSLSGNDTLLASGELYNNFVKLDVTYKNPARGQ
ncbi:galactose mutarotase-like protein [Fomitiporia mediterranea MF3/22]|uniref:galactose mutarotase-like protein n=1 Tax=Fomitiporia mediterranea (strain MF3/22) TaxID=694068 RepID=UPI00044091EF|nr:galactose mutarotase-like protein [Fomitiporia mediterranea MF3/22]EJD07057.1 galactose mutarotase-like protein [Fomitiporia mediterranea MF3/22]